MRAQLRLARVRWGLPGRFRVDNGWPWGSRGEFPTDLSLWMIGLGVGMHWNNPRRPQENGVVERSQGTSARWCEPWTCRTPAELQAMADRWAVVELLERGLPYREIHRQTGVSVTTIGRVARYLTSGNGGYRAVTERLRLNG